MGCCVPRDEQFNLNMTPKNKTRNSIVNTQNLTPSKMKNVQFTLSQIGNCKEPEESPENQSKYFYDKDFSKYNKSSFLSNMYDHPSTNRDQASFLDKNEITKQYCNVHYDTQTRFEPAIFEEFIVSKNTFKKQKSLTPSYLLNITPIYNRRESIKDEGKVSVIQPSYFNYKYSENENVEYFLNSPRHKSMYHEKNNSVLGNSFQGDSSSKRDRVSFREVDGVISERNNFDSSKKPYVKKDIQIINKYDSSQRDKERKWNRLKEKAYESNFSNNNIETYKNREMNSLLDSRVENQANLHNISACSNREILNKYIHLFGDVENYTTYNSKTNRSIFDTNRDDIVEADITNMKLSSYLNSSNIQSKLQRINLALNKRNYSESKETVKKSDINFNSGLFNAVSKSVNKIN